MVLMLLRMTGALVDLNHPGHFLHFGFIDLSEANLIVIGLVIVVFIATILIPFPKSKGHNHG